MTDRRVVAVGKRPAGGKATERVTAELTTAKPNSGSQR